MKGQGLVWSRTHEKKQSLSIRNIIKGTNILGHSMCNVPDEYCTDEGILGTTEKIGIEPARDEHLASSALERPRSDGLGYRGSFVRFGE